MITIFNQLLCVTKFWSTIIKITRLSSVGRAYDCNRYASIVWSLVSFFSRQKPTSIQQIDQFMQWFGEFEWKLYRSWSSSFEQKNFYDARRKICHPLDCRNRTSDHTMDA